jgi:hypothetical protein
MRALKKSEKFDTVLRYLKNRQNTEIPINKITTYLQSTCPGFYNTSDLSGILKGLSNDQNITTTSPDTYKVTFMGITFLEHGGYTFNDRGGYNNQQQSA